MALLSTLALAVLTTLSALAMTSGRNAQQMPVNEQPSVGVKSAVRRVQIKSSSDAPLKFETSTTNDSVPAETSIVIADGVHLTFEAIDSAVPSPAIGAFRHRQKHG